MQPLISHLFRGIIILVMENKPQPAGSTPVAEVVHRGLEWRWLAASASSNGIEYFLGSGIHAACA